MTRNHTVLMLSEAQVVWRLIHTRSHSTVGYRITTRISLGVNPAVPLWARIPKKLAKSPFYEIKQLRRNPFPFAVTSSLVVAHAWKIGRASCRERV
jgi:hypothetical protein